jgi:hypothetical protein
MKTFTAIKCILLGALLIAVGCGLRAFERATAPEALRARVLAECANALEAQVEVESVVLDGLTTLRAQQIAITPPDGSAPVFAAAGIVVELDESRLLKGLELVPRRITVLSPTIELTWLPEQQRWSFATIGLNVPPGPPTPDQLRDGVHLRDVTLRVSARGLFGDDEPRVYTDLDLTLTPQTSAADAWTLEGRFTGGLFRGVHITGDLNTAEQPSANIQLAAEDFSVGEALWRTLPFCQVVWDDVKLTGRASFVTTLAIQPDGGVRHHTLAHATDATANVSFYPLQLQSVTVTVEVTDNAVYIRNARGVVAPQAFGLTGNDRPATRLLIDGCVPFDGRPARISIRAQQLPLCERSFLSIPGVGDDIWEELAPDGTASLDLDLTIPAESDIQAVARCRLQATSIQTRGFKVKDLTGTLHYDTRNGLRTDGLTGILPTDQSAPARIGVEISVPPDGASTAIVARVENLPLTHPPIAARIQEQLGDLKAVAPSGLVDADVHVLLSGADSEPRVTVRCRLRDVALHAAGPLPFDVERIFGTLAYEGGVARLDGVRGIVRQKGAPPATVSASGIYSASGKDTALQLKISGLRTTDAVTKSIPGMEPVWEALRPQLTLDVDLLIADPTTPDGEPTVQAVVQLRGGTAHVAALQMPLAGVTGRILLDSQGKVIVENLRAELPSIGVKTGADTASDADSRPAGKPKPAPAFVEISGSSHIARQTHNYKLTATGLFIGKPMLDHIPNVGQQIWEAVRPQGLVDVSGVISSDAARTRPLQYRFDVNMKDLSVLTRSHPVPVTGLTGHVLVSERQAVCGDLTSIVCGGRATGSAVVYYGPERAKASYGASVRFRQVDLSALVEAFSGPKGKIGGEAGAEISGRLAGTVDVGGIVNSKVGSIARAHVSLSEARLWQAPLLATLIPLLSLSVPKSAGSGEASFSVIAGHTKMHSFNLTGEGMTLTGAGDISRNGKLDLDLVAVGTRDDNAGIPIISPLFGWLWRGVESRLFRVKVSGVVGKPKIEMKTLSILTAPITGIGHILATPFR